MLFARFLHRPWIQDQPWKVLEFQKTEKGFELFWKKSGRPWKVWNLSIMKVSTRLGVCVNCRSCCKAGRRTAQTVLLINITHQCFKLVRLFSWVSLGLYAIEWLTGRMALNWPWIIERKGLEILVLLVQESYICVFSLLVVPVRLSVPVQVIDWKDSSPNVLMDTLNPTHSLTAYFIEFWICCVVIYRATVIVIMMPGAECKLYQVRQKQLTH